MLDRTLKGLLEANNIQDILKVGCSDERLMHPLHKSLRDLGFANELGWKKDLPDIYGANTQAALLVFSQRNGLPNQGEYIDYALATKLIERESQLDDLRHLLNAIKNDATLHLLYKGSPHKVANTCLQNLLYDLGFGKEINWEKFGADGDYGSSTVAGLVAFAKSKNIESDGLKVSKELAQAALDELSHHYGDLWMEDYAPDPSDVLLIKEVVERGKGKVLVSDGVSSASFSKFKIGVWTTGQHTASTFVQQNPEMLIKLGLTVSQSNMLFAVSKNEGNLDAINTWDNSYLTFGMFQWTVGAGSDKGELATLVAKIKAADPAVFDKYFGRHGLDVEEVVGNYGFFSLNGTTLKTPAQKAALRSYEWAFYFWKAGQDDLVKAVELSHAASRVDVFYTSNAYKVKNFYISDLVTSEYGVALLLDNHVNRPGYVKSVLSVALDKAGLPADPKNWGTAEEGRLLEIYLAERATYGSSPMTDAILRGNNMKPFLAAGTLSAKRGSFVRLPQAAEPVAAVAEVVTPAVPLPAAAVVTKVHAGEAMG